MWSMLGEKSRFIFLKLQEVTLTLHSGIFHTFVAAEKETKHLRSA